MVLLAIGTFVAGLMLIATAFSRHPDRPGVRISAGRLIGGLLLLAGSAALGVVLAGFAVASVSNH